MNKMSWKLFCSALERETTTVFLSCQHFEQIWSIFNKFISFLNDDDANNDGDVDDGDNNDDDNNVVERQTLAQRGRFERQQKRHIWKI